MMKLRSLSRTVLLSSRAFYQNGLGPNKSIKNILCFPYSSVRSFHLSSRLLELLRFNLADIGEGIREVTIKEWYISVGDEVSQFDNICEVSSDKAAVTITSRYDGIVRKLYYNPDDTALVGEPLIDIEVNLSDSVKSATFSNSNTVNADEAVDQSELLEANRSLEVLATPAVRRLSKEHNINLANVTGSGPHGRVLKEDILGYIEMSRSASTAKVIQPVRPPITPQTKVSTEDTIVKLNTIQKAMHKTMTVASQIPHFSYCDEVNMSKIFDFRKNSDIEINYMPFFIKAASVALLQFPQLNAQIHEDGESLVLKGSHNIGIAVDTGAGLVVPKIHNVQDKTIQMIYNEIRHLAQKARDGKLGPKDLKDGTFTLSNIGSIGGTYTKPVILSPEIVIGGIGEIKKLPRYEGDKVVPCYITKISWSADHRVVDGATIARFSNVWKGYLENPEKLLLQLK